MAEAPKKILVPVDYQPLSSRALSMALTMAKQLGAEVSVLHVWAAPYAERALHGTVLATRDPSEQDSEHHHADGESIFERMRDECRGTMGEYLRGFEAQTNGVSLDWTIVSGEPQQEIAKFASENSIDLIVIGSHGRKAVSRWFMGSVAEHTVRHAACPVLVVPPERHPHAPTEGTE